MATLTELNDLLGSPGALGPKIKGALLVAAQSIVVNASATAPQKLWARECFESPGKFFDVALAAVLAANSGATVAAIQGATDAQVQTAVNASLPILTS